MKDLDKINVGISANSGTGDTLRDAFIKVNDNFTEVEQAIDSLDSVKVDVDELKSDNVLQKSDIANLKNKDTSQDTEITLLKQKDLAQDNRLATLESDVQGFVGDLSSVNGRIDNQATEIVNLKSKDTQQDNNILTINGKIVALEGDVSTLKQGHITQANQIVEINGKMIKTVNGIGPDVNGNVVVSGGSGGGGIGTVTSVNGVGPDGSGAVTIPVGISDAPSDGKEYVRKNATWSEAQGGGDVPTLDEVLGKGNTSIKSIRMDSDPEDWGDRSFMLDGDGLRITETSSGDVRGAFKGGYSYTEVNHRDTSIYLYNGEIEITKPLELPQATKDVQAPTFGQVKQWVTENIDSGGITDAPKDGKLYGRKDEAWSEVPIPGVLIRSTNALGGITYYLSGKGSSYTTKEALDLRISTKGTNEDALGLFATAIGYNTQALGDQSFSMGSQATAFGERSIAGGVTAMAMGMDSLALGRGTRANAKDSVALGPYSEASGVGASALGYWNEANEFGVTTVGMYCKAGPTRTTRVVGDAVFKVGVGTGSSSANRKDGLIVTNEGKVSAPSQNLDMITDAKQLATKEYVDSVSVNIPEAPNDGKIYGRKDLSWSEIVSGDEGIPDAPIDGKAYNRKDGDWNEVITQDLSTYLTISDANNTFGKVKTVNGVSPDSNGNVVVSGGGGTGGIFARVALGGAFYNTEGLVPLETSKGFNLLPLSNSGQGAVGTNSVFIGGGMNLHNSRITGHSSYGFGRVYITGDNSFGFNTNTASSESQILSNNGINMGELNIIDANSPNGIVIGKGNTILNSPFTTVLGVGGLADEGTRIDRKPRRLVIGNSINEDDTSPASLLGWALNKDGSISHQKVVLEDITKPLEADMIYDSNSKSFMYYNGTIWQSMGGSGGGTLLVSPDGSQFQLSVDNDGSLITTKL